MNPAPSLSDEATRTGDLFALIMTAIAPDIMAGRIQGTMKSEASPDGRLGARTCAWAYNEDHDALGITIFERDLSDEEMGALNLGDEDYLYAFGNFKVMFMMAMMSIATQVPPQP